MKNILSAFYRRSKHDKSIYENQRHRLNFRFNNKDGSS